MQLAEARRKKNLTQEQLGLRVGVSRSLISMIEIGSIRPYPSLKKRIARALSLKLDDIDFHKNQSAKG